MSDYKQPMEIETLCIRDTKNDQQWVARAERDGKFGILVVAPSRKSARTKARTEWHKEFGE